tara:strand:+ start:1351 stop:2802 length:1452 start_codon:yes stop_codon:yes gene_type:complete
MLGGWAREVLDMLARDTLTRTPSLEIATVLRITLLPLLVTPLLVAPLAAQWSQVTTATNPGQVRDGAMAFHNNSGNTVLFGGWPALSDTWVYDGANWSNASPATTPPGRSETAMASDFVRGVVVMFGGVGAMSDTWEWDGTDWTNMAPAVSPPGRQGHVMAYDSARGVTVLFGGTANPNTPSEFSDTWEWDGATWTQVTTANAPFETAYSCMCYDSARSVCVLTGGTSLFGAPDQSTWEYDGVNWVNRTAAVGPAPSATPGLGVQNAKIVFDTTRGVSMLYGGRTPNGTFSTDTFEYDGSAWSIVASGTPSSRTRNMMSFDMARGVPVIYGGLTGNFQTWFLETWEYSATVSASYTVFGAGCAGTNGVPSNSASGLPVLGSTMVIDIGNMPAPELMVMVLGLGVISPSVDLGFVGAPGCPAHVTADVLLLINGSAGSASFSLAVPSTPALSGFELHTQAIVVEAGVNAFGGIVSDAATATVGL